tara:strand:+ start:51719 stop:51871 length:153 start_codon:yes stop_codon:yes gene_type:complete
MDPLRPEVGIGDFKTAAEPAQNTVPLAFKENSSIREELIEDLIEADENEN